MLLGLLILAGCAAPAIPASVPETTASSAGKIETPHPASTPAHTATPTPTPEPSDAPITTREFHGLSFAYDSNYEFTNHEDGDEYRQDSATLIFEPRKAFLMIECFGISEEEAGTEVTDEIKDLLVQTYLISIVSEYENQYEADNIKETQGVIAETKALIATFDLIMDGAELSSKYVAFAGGDYMYRIGFMNDHEVDYYAEFQDFLDSLTFNVAVDESGTGAVREDAEPTPEPADAATASQRNAIMKAKDYLDYTAFSKEGLVDQLEYEGFTRDQAEYGAAAVGLE